MACEKGVVIGPVDEGRKSPWRANRKEESGAQGSGLARDRVMTPEKERATGGGTDEDYKDEVNGGRAVRTVNVGVRDDLEDLWVRSKNTGDTLKHDLFLTQDLDRYEKGTTGRRKATPGPNGSHVLSASVP